MVSVQHDWECPVEPLAHRTVAMKQREEMPVQGTFSFSAVHPTQGPRLDCGMVPPHSGMVLAYLLWKPPQDMGRAVLS